MNIHLPKILAVLILAGSSLGARSAVVLTIGSVAGDTADSYATGASFIDGPNGSFMYAVGNINTTATKSLALFKFDLSSLAGDTGITAASFTVTQGAGASGTGVGTHAIQLVMLAYSLTSGAFVAGDATTTSVTTVGTLATNVANRGTTMTYNVTTALQAAFAAGYDYVGFRLNDVTADGGAPGKANWVGFSSTTLPTLSVTAIPEPHVGTLLLSAFVGIAIFRFRRGLKLQWTSKV